MPCSTHAYEHKPARPRHHHHCAACALQIARRRRAHQEQHPDAKIISLGIGDTTEPLPKVISDAMAKAANGLATREGYSG
jgi:aspartate/methionine/tyrosine aminotransferase